MVAEGPAVVNAAAVVGAVVGGCAADVALGLVTGVAALGGPDEGGIKGMANLDTAGADTADAGANVPSVSVRNGHRSGLGVVVVRGREVIMLIIPPVDTVSSGL